MPINFKKIGIGPKIKLDQYSLFIPIIPFFHHSSQHTTADITPLVWRQSLVLWDRMLY